MISVFECTHQCFVGCGAGPCGGSEKRRRLELLAAQDEHLLAGRVVERARFVQSLAQTLASLHHVDAHPTRVALPIHLAV